MRMCRWRADSGDVTVPDCRPGRSRRALLRQAVFVNHAYEVSSGIT